MYKDLLKKEYKSVLSYNYSCLNKLKEEKEIILRLLSQNKFKKYRFEKCHVCKKFLDKLDDGDIIVSFIRLSKENKNSHEWNGYWVHKKCKSKAKIPNGWKKF